METTSYLSRPQVVVETDLTEEPIDTCRIISSCTDPAAGGMSVFIGTVRNHSKGKSVDHLFYEAYKPMAKEMIRKFCNEAVSTFGLTSAVCIHRIGKVDVTEPAVIVVTTSPHRDEAYKGSRYIIEKVKHEVPVWKNEFFSDGSSEWGGNCSCH